MPNAKREKLKKRQVPAKVETAEQSDVLGRLPGEEVFGSDYPRLFIALQDGNPGELLFIQLNSPVQRRHLPEQLKADGLQHPFAVADFSTFPMGPPPYGVLREFLEDLPSPSPEILFIDGLEHWIDADPETIQALNLGRERLANLGVVVVFLLPAYVINLIRTHALNLWSWRAHYYSLESKTEEVQHDGALPPLDTGHTISPGDTPEARERRIRILRRLLEEGLAEHRTIDSLARSVLFPLAFELYGAGRFSEALAVLEKLEKSFEDREDSEEKALFYNRKGLVLSALGRSGQAELLFKQALAIREKVLGPEHPDVAKSLTNLGGLYKRQGQYAHAEALYQQALTIAEKTLDPDHPEVAINLANLAELYRLQNRYSQAESLYQRALTIAEKVWGLDQSYVTIVLNNLAALYRSTGQYSKAESLLQHALKTRERTLGAEHPHVAGDLNNLAILYVDQGHYVQAEPLYRRALAIVEKTLGRQHPSVATILENYAALLRKTNREAEAAELEARAQAIRAKHTQENLISQPS